MHDPGERVLGPDGVQDLGQRTAVRHVTRRETCLGPRLGQFGHEVGRSRSVRTPAAQQEQMPHAVLGDEVTCHHSAQHTAGTRHQHGAGRFDEGGYLPDRQRHPCQPRYEHLTRAHCGLRLTRSHDSRQQRLLAVVIHQDEPPGVLRLGRPQKTPHSSLYGIGRVTEHRALRHHHQPRICEPLVRQPLLHQLQCPARDLMRTRRDVLRTGIGAGAGSGTRERHRHHVRHLVHRGQIRIPLRAGEELRFPDNGPGALRAIGALGDADRFHGPFHAEQRVRVGVTASAQLLRGDRAQRQRLHRGDMRSGSVGQQQRRSRSLTADANPQELCAHCGQGHAGPGERQAYGSRGSVRVGARCEAHRVQCGVQESWMQPEAVGLGVVREGHLRIYVVTLPPRGPQPLEQGAVLVPGIGERRVERVHRDCSRSSRRPVSQAVRRLCPGGECAAGVPRPGLVRGVGGAGEHRDLVPAGQVGRGHRDLDDDRVLFGDEKRCLDRQLFHEVAADLVGGLQSEFHEGCARQQDRAPHSVVGEPGVRLDRDPARHHDTVGAGQAHRAGQHGVVEGLQPRRGDVHGAVPGGGVQPEALMLEGVGGQVDALGPGAREQGLPVELDPLHVCFGEGGHEAAWLVLVPS